ncbi:RHS repeat-associated core domain-containing protein [Burkholderia sp. BCC1993]|uniref:RHS repeat domain-containing protein n=1 Tax=Burkholderia sp. BCC1993 TaxID=2817444 RepID=UPI002AAFC580|nr:RHS repeat-associated core domain-containing protein [Burkholderia sp. BCC1993]
MPADATNSQIPAIRTFQFDSSSVGDLSSSVNLFRGDINFTQTLLSMPGRTAGDNLDLTLSLLYQSNVHEGAITWNRDAPTGALGLGWTMPAPTIVLNDAGSLMPATRSYCYVSQSISTDLAREPTTPFVFSMNGTIADSLVNGGTVPAAAVAAFGANGLVLSPASRVSSTGASAWQLADDANQQLYELALDGAVLNVFDGGESYQLVNYEFWKILYYACYERWVIVKDNGLRLSFGGLSANVGNYAASVGNSIEWGVRWASGNGTSGAPVALWQGSSGSIDGQYQYARAWHLSAVTNPWGDGIAYRYNDWPRTSAGLLPNVEQLVGAGGLPYTKACYLTGMTDVFGREVVLQYGDKMWANTTPQSPREYADPHKSVPDTQPNAYQDRYETLYLQRIAVADATGAPLFSFAFDYRPSSPAGGAGSPVANVTSHTGELFGDTCKRFLTGIVLSNAAGESLPGLAFDYYFDATATGASPGALKSITYSEGATATYVYTKQALDICDRSLSVSPPTGTSFAGATPRVFFGKGYAVVTWYGTASGALSVEVYSWLGSWRKWQPTSDGVLFRNTTGLDLSSLEVVACEDFFALSFAPGSASNSTTVYIFQADNARPAQWIPATINGVVTGYNTPSLTYSSPSGSVSLTGGDTFLIAATTDVVHEATSYDRVTWRWPDAAWTVEHFTVQALALAVAYNEYYLLLDMQGNVSLFALDACLKWGAATRSQIGNFSASSPSSVTLSPSDSFVAVSNLLSTSDTQISYTVTIVQWDALYRPVLPMKTHTFDDRIDSEDPGVQRIAGSIGNELVAVAGHVLRFNGKTWLENNTLQAESAPTGLEQRYAYGPDYALSILAYPNGGGDTTAQVLSFDPNTDFGAWTRKPATPAQTLPIDFSETSNWPSGGGTDWLTLGQYLYFRGHACEWDGVVGQTPCADIQARVNEALGGDGNYVLNAEAVIDEAPQFLAYFVSDSTSPESDQAAATLLRNGRVSISAQAFAQERIYTADEGDVGAGTYPGGAGMFVAYPGADGDFDNASRIILHSYAGDAVEGRLHHYAVTGLSIDNGLGQTSATCFAPEPATAACDPTGQVFKYYTSIVYPGTGDPSRPQFGRTVNRYLNGLNVRDGSDFYDMLDGQLHQVDTYDTTGALLASTTTQWKVYVARAASPTDPGAGTLNLKGGFLCRTTQTTIEDGVTSSQTARYVGDGFTAPFSGNVVGTDTTTYGGTGQLETFRNTTLYAYEMNDPALAAALLAQHRFGDIAQSVTHWRRDGGEAVVSQASASTYALFPCVYDGVVVPAQAGKFIRSANGRVPFPFTGRDAGAAPQGWLPSTATIACTPYGQPTETRDAMGVAQSTLYGTDSAFAVALFTNASVARGECAYYGFESYETGRGWNVNGCRSVVGDAHTGTTSLALAPNGEGTVSVQLSPANVDATYLLGFWYKTPAGFTPVAGAGFTATLSVDGTAGTPRFAPFADSGGTWVYCTLGIPVTAGQGSVTLAVAAANASSDVVLLDNVFVTPLVSKMTVRVYDPSYRLLTATLDAAGTTMQRRYNAFQRLTATIGTDQQVKTMSIAFLSREGNAGGRFDAAAPNADLSVSPDLGGTLETFMTGDEWQQRWAAGNVATNWRCSGGALQHTAATNDTLTWQGGNFGGASTTAFYVEIAAQGTLAGAVGVTFGAGYSIGYDPAAGFSFAAPDGSIVQNPLGAPPNLPVQWLLVLGNGRVAFFGDGQLLFSTAVNAGDPAAIRLSTGPNTLALTNVAMLAGVRLAVAFRDGAGRKRQTQQWLGSDAVVSATIADALGRTIAITRSAPASFGGGATQPLFGYRASFVDVGAFLAATQDTWAMTGDVADYYAGQNDGVASRSNDQGYPYFGYRFEASPRTRRIEQGAPGKAYAVHDLASTTSAQRQTTQIAFGANTTGAFDLPANYVAQTVTGPVKNQLLRLRDTHGREVGSSISDRTGAVSGQSLASVDFSATGSTTSISEPNSFTDSPQQDPAAYVSALQRDGAGRTLESTDTDSAGTAFICDRSSRVRFVQPALDPDTLGFIYFKYDALGRVTEQGTVAQPWDESTLSAHASDPGWPGGDVPFTVVRRNDYDGNGNDPTRIGRKTASVAYNLAPSNIAGARQVQVNESFTYDANGRVTAATLAVDGLPAASGAVGYAYNNLDQIVSIAYPSSSPLANVYYRYDQAAHVTGIGSSPTTPTDIASYAYTPDGDIEQEIRNGGTLAAAYGYASPGWPVSQTVAVAGRGSASFAIGYGYYANGAPQSRTISLAFDTPSTSTTAFSYDAQGRLVDALVDDASTGSEQVGQYDANGNIWSLTQDGGQAYAFVHTAGTNRLDTLTIDGGASTSFTYDARGNLTDTGTMTLDYDTATNMVLGVASANGGMTQQFAYNGVDQRVMRLRGSATQADVYFNGLGRRPLLALLGGTWSAFVYGPTGLVAAASDQRYFPLKDAAQSIWAVVDSQNQLVARFAYRAFGSLASSDGPNQAAVPFRFMGREYDDASGLYNFSARLYSPGLRRFLSADSARQTASPYLFVGNNPLVFADPSGNKITVGEQVGIGIGMAALMVVGLVLSFFTFGAAEAPVAVLEEGMADGLAAGEAGGDALVDGAASTASAGSSTASSSASSCFNITLSTTSKLAATSANFLTQVTTNTMFGVGFSGFEYDCRPGNEFTRKGFAQALEIGAASGALFGAMSFGYATLAADAIKAIPSLLARTGIRMLVNVTEGIAANDLTQMATNGIEHKPWSLGLAEATWTGAVGGLPFGIGDVLLNDGKTMWDQARSQFSDRVGSARVGEPAPSGLPGTQAQDEKTPLIRARADSSDGTHLLSSPSLNSSYGTMGTQ